MGDEILSQLEKEILIFLVAFYIIAGSYGNICVIFGIVLSKGNRHRPSNVFSLGLAVGDFLSCTCIGGFQLFSLLVEGEIFKNAIFTCRIVLVMIYALQAVSILSLTSMCADRFIALRFPYKYNALVTWQRASLAVFILWVECIVVFLPVGIVNGWASYENRTGICCGVIWKSLSAGYIAVMGSINLFIPGIIIGVSNCTVFYIARKQNRKLFNLKSRFLRANEITSEKSMATTRCKSHRDPFHDDALNHTQGENVRDRFLNGAVKRTGLGRRIFPKLSRTQSDTLVLHDHFSTDATRLRQGNKKRFQKIWRRKKLRCFDNVAIRLPHWTGKPKSIGVVSCPKEPTQSQVDISHDCITTSFILQQNGSDNQRGEAEKIQMHAGEKGANVKSCSNTSDAAGYRDAACVADAVGASDRGSSAGSNGSVAHGHDAMQLCAKQIENSKQKKISNLASKAEWKIASSTLLILICFVLSYIPWVVVRLSLMMTEPNYKAVVFTAFVALLSSFWNPYIILMTRSEIRRSARGSWFFCL